MEVHNFVLAVPHREVQDAEHLARAVLDVVHVARMLFVQHPSAERGHWESSEHATAPRWADGREVAQRVAVQVQGMDISHIDLVRDVRFWKLGGCGRVVEDRQELHCSEPCVHMGIDAKQAVGTLWARGTEREGALCGRGVGLTVGICAPMAL